MDKLRKLIDVSFCMKDQIFIYAISFLFETFIFLGYLGYLALISSSICSFGGDSLNLLGLLITCKAIADNTLIANPMIPIKK